MMEEGIGARKVLDTVAGGDFVEVMFAKSLEEAKACCAVLAEENIAARYEKSSDATDGGIAILVPESHFVDATEILSSRTQDQVVDDEVDEELEEQDELVDIEDVDEDEELDDDDDDDDDDDEDEDAEEEVEEDDEY